MQKLGKTIFITSNCRCLGSFAKLRKATVSFVMSVRPSVRMENSALTGRVFKKFDIVVFFENLSRKFKFY